MNRKRMTTRFALLALLCVTLSPAAASAQGGRAQAEQEVRKAAYEQRLAQATGDVKTFKRTTAERTLALYRFSIDVLLGIVESTLGPGGRTDADGQDAAPAKTSGREALFDLMIRESAALLGQSLPREEVGRRARAEVAGPITFVGERTARIAPPDGQELFVVFEGGRWKVDDTEYLKKELLSGEKAAAPDFPGFTPQQREQIRKF